MLIACQKWRVTRLEISTDSLPRRSRTLNRDTCNEHVMRDGRVCKERSFKDSDLLTAVLTMSVLIR